MNVDWLKYVSISLIDILIHYFLWTISLQGTHTYIYQYVTTWQLKSIDFCFKVQIYWFINKINIKYWGNLVIKSSRTFTHSLSLLSRSASHLHSKHQWFSFSSLSNVQVDDNVWMNWPTWSIKFDLSYNQSIDNFSFYRLHNQDFESWVIR